MEKSRCNNKHTSRNDLDDMETPLEILNFSLPSELTMNEFELKSDPRSIRKQKTLMRDLSKHVKKLKRKLKNYRLKFHSNTNKILNLFLKESFEQVTCNVSTYNEFNFEFLSKTINMLCESYDSEFQDERYVLSNLVSLIANKKLRLDSLKFKHICSIVRSLLVNSHHSKIPKISKIEQKYLQDFSSNFCLNDSEICMNRLLMDYFLLNEEKFQSTFPLFQDFNVQTKGNNKNLNELNVNANQEPSDFYVHSNKNYGSFLNVFNLTDFKFPNHFK